MSVKPKRIIDDNARKVARERPCVVCGARSDAAHIKSVGSGGDDVESNLLSICRRHHQEQHSVGWTRFIKRYPAVYFELTKKGWDIIDGKLRHAHAANSDILEI